jgi:hypothetical protein
MKSDGMLSEVFYELSVPHTCVLSEVFSNLEHMYDGMHMYLKI